MVGDEGDTGMGLKSCSWGICSWSAACWIVLIVGGAMLGEPTAPSKSLGGRLAALRSSEDGQIAWPSARLCATGIDRDDAAPNEFEREVSTVIGPGRPAGCASVMNGG